MIAVFVSILVALAAIGAPLFLIVGTATALCFLWFTPEFQGIVDLLPLMQNMEGLLTKQEFLAIPLFMASGAVMTAGGIAKRLVDVAAAALGWLPGGMAVAAVAACMFFAAISGSSPVTLIAVGSIMLPAMVKSNYPENFSIGLVTTAGSLGCLVPPSIAMLIYAITLSGSRASVSPEDLFLAGLVPALFIAGLLALYSIWVGRKDTSRAPFSRSQLTAALREGIWALLLPVIVLGGIYGGMYTPSEAGAAAMIYALAVTFLIYREMTFRKLLTTLVEAATLMGSLILIIVLAFGLNEFLALIDIQSKLMDLIRRMDLGPFGFMLLVNVLLIVIGALMDSISCTLIFAPMLAPVAYELYGIDPLHFGVVFVVNMEIGYLAPPVATNLFVAAAVFRKPFGQVVRAVLPTLTIVIGALIVIMYVPTVSKAAINWKLGKPLVESFPWEGRPKQERQADDEPVVVDTVPDQGPPSGGIDLGSLTRKAMGDSVEPDEAEDVEEDRPAPGGGIDLGDLTRKAMQDAEEDEPEAQPEL
jgi:C4-dicarboxylate transporter DctM subunit